MIHNMPTKSSWMKYRPPLLGVDATERPLFSVRPARVFTPPHLSGEMTGHQKVLEDTRGMLDEFVNPKVRNEVAVPAFRGFKFVLCPLQRLCNLVVVVFRGTSFPSLSLPPLCHVW